MEKEMNRRELMAAMSIFPFVGKQKVRLDRIKMMSFTIDGQAMYLSKIETSDTYFDPKLFLHLLEVKYNDHDDFFDTPLSLKLKLY